MTKETLIAILNSELRWDLIDLLLRSETHNSFTEIDVIFKSCLNKSLGENPKNFWYITKMLLYGSLDGFISVGIQQNNMILTDYFYADQEYVRYLKLTFDKNPHSFVEWRSNIRLFSDIINFPNMLSLIIFQFFHVCYPWIAKPHEFHDNFNNQMAEYILNLYNLGSLDPEVVTFINNLLI